MKTPTWMVQAGWSMDDPRESTAVVLAVALCTAANARGGCMSVPSFKVDLPAASPAPVPPWSRHQELDTGTMGLVAGASLQKGDKSPVTVADFAAQAIVSHLLAEVVPSIPMVGEGAVFCEKQATRVFETRWLHRFRPVLPSLSAEGFCPRSTGAPTAGAPLGALGARPHRWHQRLPFGSISTPLRWA